MPITVQREKKMLPRLQGENRTGLRIEVGPDRRMRLVLDKTGADGSKQNFISSACLARGEIGTLASEGMLDVQGDDFDY